MQTIMLVITGRCMLPGFEERRTSTFYQLVDLPDVPRKNDYVQLESVDEPRPVKTVTWHRGGPFVAEVVLGGDTVNTDEFTAVAAADWHTDPLDAEDAGPVNRRESDDTAPVA